MIGDAAGFIISLLGMLTGVMISVGWLSVGLYLLLALRFAYFQFMSSK